MKNAVRDVRYYISTGMTGALYTLRTDFYDVSSYDNYSLVKRSLHLLTLSTDWEQSIKKAQNYLDTYGIEQKLDISVQPVLRNMTREKVDHSILRFGKYQGRSIFDLEELDRPYLIWMAENMTSKTHAKTIDMIKEMVAKDLEDRREAAKQQEIEKAQKEQSEAERLANLDYVGIVGKREEFSVTYTGNTYFDTAYGTTVLHFFRDEDGNELVWRTTYGLYNEKGNIEPGEKITVKATVKNHNEYKGRKQTNLSRLVVL